MHVFNERSNTKMTIGVELYLLIKLVTSCFAIPFVDGHEIQVLKLNERKIIIWEAINIKGLIGYHSFKTIMDGSYYFQILQDHLIPNARRQFGRRWRLQQDNDPEYKNRLGQQSLSSEVAEVIDWSSNSPDANPVENLWSIIKHRMEKRKTNKSRRIK